MTAITDHQLETVLTVPEKAPVQPSLTTPILVSAVREHVLAWVDNLLRFGVGALLAWGLVSVGPEPGLAVFAAISAATGWLYIANLADVERYRDAILFIVPTLFVWVVLALGVNDPTFVGLTLFTHVFMSFVGAFARNTGTLRLLRLWSLLLGFQLVLLVYLVVNFLR